MSFRSTVLIVPGLGDSGPDHWQSKWEEYHRFKRVVQDEWERPVKSAWVARLDEMVRLYPDVILVGHSLACNTIVSWAATANVRIKGALLVAPSDTEAETYPPGTSGFVPMPMNKLEFPSITVASTNDPYVSIDRARAFATAWGSRLVIVPDAGHINVASGHGEWHAGLELLRSLDK